VTGETCSSGDWRQAYANYLVEYLELYASAGITIDFVGFLNEPEFALVSPKRKFTPLFH
jgi:O-glycosyl hydrolase